MILAVFALRALSSYYSVTNESSPAQEKSLRGGKASERLVGFGVAETVTFMVRL